MSEPICKWGFEQNGTLKIWVKPQQFRPFVKWLNDEYSECEDEMYVLVDQIKERIGEAESVD